MDELDEYEAFVNRLKLICPEMYEDVYCGISIGPGWYPIIEALSRSIAFHVKNNNEVRELRLKENRYNLPIPETMDFPKVAQIKEKFGGLRFYYDGNSDEYINGLVRMAENWAHHTCEQCGNSGQIRHGGWIKVLCDEHEEERQKRYKGTQ